MNKLFRTALTICLAAVLVSCGDKGSGKDSDKFIPALDTSTNCNIRVVGDYSNFEALEAEFDRFNEYYPDVHLSYVKLDDYKNTLSTVLEGNDKPNIFFSYTWMIGNDKYNSVIEHMEELSNPSLKLNLDCIRQGLINHQADNKVYMVPVFSRTYGTLINNNLFEKENVKIPTTQQELVTACTSFLSKGYTSPMMGYSLASSSSWMNTVAYPLFVAALANNPEALALANNLDPAAGEYTRKALEAVKQLVDDNYVSNTECNKITDNYTQVILRFFEGDVPMMICTGDTVSGTKKRESQSETFIKNPFNYSFYPLPLTEQGGYFIDSPSVEFSVNKACENLDMTNEFMRFLISNRELNEMASAKRLVTPTKEMSLDSVYAPFAKVPSERTFSPEVLGVKDQLAKQIREAAYKVGKGELSVDDAVSMYGSF